MADKRDSGPSTKDAKQTTGGKTVSDEKDPVEVNKKDNPGRAVGDASKPTRRP